MASGSQLMTTYYAKRIVGDASAAQADKALLQTGTNVTADTWILARTNRSNSYGIKYVYDTTTTTIHDDENDEDITTNNGHDKVEFYGGSATASAWVQLDTGDILVNNIDSHGNINLYFADGIGIGLTDNGHIESTQANDYRKGVYFTDTNGNIVSWHESYIMENRTNTMFESANLVNDTLVYGGMQVQIRNSGESYISLLMTHASSNGSSRMIDMCHYTDNTNEILLNADTKPRTTNVYNLGSDSRIWKDAYIYNLNIGAKGATTAPTELTASNRIIIIPYYHTGGPWYIKSMDDNTNAYLALYYGTSELLRVKHEGTFQADIKANITGNAATATKLSNTPNTTTTFLRGDNTWTNTLTGTFYSTGSPGFQNVTEAGTWAYLQLKSGTLGWDIASVSSQNSGALDFRPHKSTNHGIMISQDGGLYFRNPATEGIYYAGTKATHRMIRFIDNASDTYGNGIGIGGGGLVVIGAGESSDTLLSNLSLTSSGGTETTYITSDGNIEFYPGINGWDASARIWMSASYLNIGIDGNTTRESGIYVNSGAGRINLYSAASATGNRGLWVPAHGSGSAKNIILVDTNNNITFNGDVTGNAATASKLGTATVGGANRGIYLNGGTATALSWYYDWCSISGGNKANYPWHRFATCTTGAGQWTDKTVIIVLHSRYDGGPYGMVKLSMRTNASGGAKSTSAVWIYRKGFAVDDIKISAPAKTTGTDETINAYIKCGTYPRRIAYILEGSNIGWSLVASNEPDNTTTSDKKGGTEINASVSGNNATDGATVSYANSAGSSGTCTGNAATATAVLDAGDTSKKITIRYQGSGASATDWIPFHDSNGNLVPVSSTNLANKVRDKASGSWGISVTGSSASCTGNAATATALGTNAGNANTPVYFTGGKPSACNNKLGAQSANGYWGMGSADNAFNVWIRTTTQGIIPYQSGGKGSGHCGLGTSSWYFSTAYIDTITSNKTYGAVWNDIAECRKTITKEPGRVVVENKSGIMELSSIRMQATGRIISDTYGYCMGEPANDGTPIAIAGRVLVYPYRKIEEYNLGDCVCSAPNGTVDIMTREEIKEYPDRIIGIVSEIPTYEVWSGGAQNGKDDIPVNGRIWIYVR